MTQHVDTHFVTQASCCETTITLKDLLLGQFVVLKCSNLRAILLQQLPHFRQFSYNSAGNFSQPSMTISHLSICWRLLDIYVAHFCKIWNLVADNFFLKTWMKSSSRNETNQRICLCKQAHVLLHVFIFHDGVQIVCVTKLGPKEKSSYFLPSGECIIYVNWISIIIPSTINSSKSRTDQLSKENARSVHVWRLEIQILARLVQWSSTNFCRWS